MGDRSKMRCPRCGSGDFTRLHRSRLEKICRRNPKFRCAKCDHRFFGKLPKQDAKTQS